MKKTRAIHDSASGTVRVAIYTRKSTDEGLDQEFNSLDAQRQSVEAYITSQRSEGWVGLTERYDDGGYTGANTDRPAFKRLLADIRAARVDVVAVYKIDRLSRSMLDFVGLMEIFRQHGVTFCSVTQQFSTTNAVGRMTLNLLATFAEFEREQISERTRDKMRAARRRGMWTGGPVPLGYDLHDKKLVVNAEEAKRVNVVFALYLELGSLTATVEELNRRGWRTKSWTTHDGKLEPGSAFTKSNLHRMLSSPLYVGLTTLGKETFPGAHEVIVERSVWDAAQVRRTQNGRRGGADTRNTYGALLRGLIVCGVCGSTMIHSVSSRGTRRWSYYVCMRAEKQGAKACPKSRVSRGEIEEFVVAKIREIGRDPALVRAAIEAATRDAAAKQPELIADVRRLEQDGKRYAAERANLVEAVARGGPAADTLMRRVGELDGEINRAAQRLATARRELLVIGTHALDENDLREALAAFDPVWDELFPREKARVLALLIERIVYDARSYDVQITFRPGGVKSLGPRRVSA